MKIGIIGYGVLGQTLETLVEDDFINPVIYDTGRKIGSPEEINQADIIFVCVPTPMHTDTGEVDLSCVQSAVGCVQSGKTVVIRSTVPPGTCEKLQIERPDLNIVFVPEFLRERHAFYDAQNQTRIIIGSVSGKIDNVVHIFKTVNPSAIIITTTTRKAESYKYACNCLLAFQVGAANEIARICDVSDVDYESIRSWFCYDGRIGDMHQVPGIDGQYGFGGKCFPKDTAGLLAHSKKCGYEAPFLQALIDFNNDIREVHDWLEIPGATTECGFIKAEDC